MAHTRTRLALYQATAAKRRSSLRELDDKLAGLPDQIEQARLDYLRRTPTKRSDALGSEVQKLRREQQDTQRERDNLAEELAAVQTLITDTAAALSAEMLAQYRANAAAFDAAERAAWVMFGEKFTELLDAFNGVLDTADSRAAYVAGVAWDNHDERLECEPLLRRTWQQPFPIDLVRAVEMTVDAAADPKGWGSRNDGPGVDARLGRLVEVMPDLRAIYRHGTLSGGVGANQTSSNRQASEGSAPLGSFSAPLPARGLVD